MTKTLLPLNGRKLFQVLNYSREALVLSSLGKKKDGDPPEAAQLIFSLQELSHLFQNNVLATSQESCTLRRTPLGEKDLSSGFHGLKLLLIYILCHSTQVPHLLVVFQGIVAIKGTARCMLTQLLKETHTHTVCACIHRC